MDRHRNHLGDLLRHVHVSGPLSRAALAGRMGVNRSTILAWTAELVAAGLVREEHPAGTTGAGRPSLMVVPESERVWVLAFDVAVDRLVAARVGLGGRILDRRETARPRAGVDLDTVVRKLAALGHELVDPGSRCVGIGASYCGMIRPGDGMVRYGPEMGWVDQAFGAELGRALGLGLPVAVGNEAHLGALAEYERGAGAGHPDLIYLHGDVGVGGGILVDGKLLGGESGYGCEVGHMLVNPVGGRPCLCGSHGCLEAETGEYALLDAAGRAPHPLTAPAAGPPGPAAGPPGPAAGPPGPAAGPPGPPDQDAEDSAPATFQGAAERAVAQAPGSGAAGRAPHPLTAPAAGPPGPPDQDAEDSAPATFQGAAERAVAQAPGSGAAGRSAVRVAGGGAAGGSVVRAAGGGAAGGSVVRAAGGGAAGGPVSGDAGGRAVRPFGRDAVRSVVRDAAEGDPAAAAAVAEIGDWLGIGVANLINLFNPGVVIFGGMLRDVYAQAAPQVAARIAQHAMPVSRERAQLRLSALADDATLLGAAGLGFAPLLTDPLEPAGSRRTAVAPGR